MTCLKQTEPHMSGYIAHCAKVTHFILLSVLLSFRLMFVSKMIYTFIIKTDFNVIVLPLTVLTLTSLSSIYLCSLTFAPETQQKQNRIACIWDVLDIWHLQCCAKVKDYPFINLISSKMTV